jgi:hypothetical protein
MSVDRDKPCFVEEKVRVLSHMLWVRREALYNATASDDELLDFEVIE